MGKYDSADVDTTARTVKFGAKTYSLMPDAPDGLSYVVHLDGKQVGTVAYIAGGAYVSTGHAEPLDAIAAVADAYLAQLAKEGRKPGQK